MSFCLAESYFCRHGSTVYDRCGQKCTCLRGRYRNCFRIRKEFTAMTFGERVRYTRIVKTASTDRRYKGQYDRLINEHERLFRSSIHEKIFFLPWHRWFILEYENLLRKIDCKFTVAYWDWSVDSSDPWSTHRWEDVWHSVSGFGGNGVGAERCVKTGPFRHGAWVPVSSTGAKCLTRDFNGSPPDDVAVQEVVLMNDFTNFELALRTVLHDDVHCRISGTMCTLQSASAPEFFLHHGFVDKIWDDWQKRSISNRFAYFPYIHRRMSGTPYFPKALINLRQQPGGVRVEYRPSQKENRMKNRLKGLSFTQLRALPRKPFTPLGPKAIRLFHVSQSEVIKAKQLEKLLQPRKSL